MSQNRAAVHQQSYLYAVERFSRHFRLLPDQLGLEQIRTYQLYLVAQKLSWSHVNQVTCALRFLYGVTLGQKEMVGQIVSGREPENSTGRSDAAASKLLPMAFSCALWGGARLRQPVNERSQLRGRAKAVRPPSNFQQYWFAIESSQNILETVQPANTHGFVPEAHAGSPAS